VEAITLTVDQAMPADRQSRPPLWSAALMALTTIGAAVLALYFVVLPAAAWIEAAVNQSQGGAEFLREVIQDLVFAAIAPLVFSLVLWRGRLRGKGWLASFRSAAGYGSLVGFPLLVLRILAAAPFF